MNPISLRHLPILITAACLASIALVAQPHKADAPKAAVETKAAPKGKPLEFKGKVTAVGKNRLTVNHGDVPGFMPAMTMPYKVDKVDVLKSIKVGDQVQATVYAEDDTLYDLKVLPAKGK